MSSSSPPQHRHHHYHDEVDDQSENDDHHYSPPTTQRQQQQQQQHQESESPFTNWRRLRNNPRFIEAVTNFCDYEADMRYQVALEYASWWPSNVRNFRFELLIIVERDISVELIIEREGRKQIWMQEDEACWRLEEYWNHKQIFAFWPRWIEHAHAIISARLWTQESVIRNELTHRMQIIDRSEIAEREAIIKNVKETAIAKELPWGDFVPPKYQKLREEEALRIARITQAQERDVEVLKELYRKQIVQVLRQKWDDMMTAWEAGRLRIVWASEQEFDQIVEKCFPSAALAMFDGGDEVEVEDSDDE